MKKKFSALRTIGTIYKVVGVILAILTILVRLVFASSVLPGAPSSKALRLNWAAAPI